jgi:hypothetical protein
MKSPLIALVVLSLALTGCGRVRDSRLNPFNWFGHSREVATTLAPEGGYAKAIDDYRVPVATVTALEIKQVQGGVMIVAKGLPATQGWWDAELVADNDATPVDGGLNYTFLVSQPLPQTAVASRVSTPQSREITAGLFISNFKLGDDVRKITVTGTGNARSVSR